MSSNHSYGLIHFKYSFKHMYFNSRVRIAFYCALAEFVFTIKIDYLGWESLFWCFNFIFTYFIYYGAFWCWLESLHCRELYTLAIQTE